MASDGSAKITEISDQHAVQQIDGDVFKPAHLAGYKGDLPATEMNNHSEAALFPQEDLK